MTKGNKIILGIFTFLPLVLLCIYFVTVALFVRHTFYYEQSDMPFPILGDLLSMVIVALALGLLSFGLLIYYITHALNNLEIEINERLVWVLAFIFISLAAFPVYWYVRIWKRHEHLTMATT